MQEIELKFLVPESRLKGLMRQVNVKSSQTISMAAHYYDTPQSKLAAHDIGLRIRREGEQWVQTIKAGGDGIAARLEHNMVLDSEHVQTMLAADTLLPDLSIYKGTFIAPALANFKLKKLAKKLSRQYVTDVERITRLLEEKPSDNDSHGENGPSNSIEIAYDKGSIIHGEDDSQRHPIHEIEFELITGDLEFLFTTAKTWCQRYQLCLSTVTKAERGGLLLQGQRYSPAVKADLQQFTVKKNSSQTDFIRSAVRHCLLQVLPNASAIVDGSTTIDHVQQLIHGLERLQAVLGTYQKLVDSIDINWLPVLKQTSDALIEYELPAVIAAKIEPKLMQQQATAIPSQQVSATLIATLRDAVRANEFQLTLLELIAFTMNVTLIDKVKSDKNVPVLPTDLLEIDLPKASSSAIESLAMDNMAEILDKQQQKLLRNIEKASIDSKNSDLAIQAIASDKITRQLTTLRYLSEFAAHLYADNNYADEKDTIKQSKRWLKQIARTQKALTTYRNTLRYQHYYQQQALTDTTALFGAGWLAATLITDSKRYKKQLAKLQKCEVFW